jgi:hypothetical protein
MILIYLFSTRSISRQSFRVPLPRESALARMTAMWTVWLVIGLLGRVLLLIRLEPVVFALALCCGLHLETGNSALIRLRVLTGIHSLIPRALLACSVLGHLGRVAFANSRLAVAQSCGATTLAVVVMPTAW